jgi:hypothetical protein
MRVAISDNSVHLAWSNDLIECVRLTWCRSVLAYYG